MDLLVRNVMSSVLNYQPNVVVLSKLDSSRNIFWLCGRNTVQGRVAQITEWIRDLRASDRGTGINQRIAVCNRRGSDPSIVSPVADEVLTCFGIISCAWIAWFCERLILDELSVYSVVESIPF